jgi:hypothetical protein
VVRYRRIAVWLRKRGVKPRYLLSLANTVSRRFGVGLVPPFRCFRLKVYPIPYGDFG